MFQYFLIIWKCHRVTNSLSKSHTTLQGLFFSVKLLKLTLLPLKSCVLCTGRTLSRVTNCLSPSHTTDAYSSKAYFAVCGVQAGLSRAEPCCCWWEEWRQNEVRVAPPLPPLPIPPPRGLSPAVLTERKHCLLLHHAVVWRGGSVMPGGGGGVEGIRHA